MSSKDNTKRKYINSVTGIPDGVSSRFDITVNSIKSANKATPEKKVAVIDIEGVIGFDWEKYFNDEAMNDSNGVRSQLAEIDALDVDEININIINSPGGIISDGIAIHDHLASHKATITTNVVGYAASIATVIMQAASHENRRMSANAKVLSHGAMTPPHKYMNAQDLKDELENVEMLDRQIMSIMTKRGVSEGISEPMSKNGGHGRWILADEAKELGLVDEVYEPYSAVACAGIDHGKFNAVAKAFNLPEMENNLEDSRREPEINNANPKEESMTPEEIAALAAKAAVTAVAELNKSKEPVAVVAPVIPAVQVEEVNVEFDGDKLNPEDVAKHINKVKNAQLVAATDFNDVNSVLALHKALAGEDSVASKGPKGNTDLTKAPVVHKDQEAINKKQDQEDTLAFFSPKESK